jgi:hypothetical protein
MPRVSGIEGQKCLPYRRNMGLLGWDANPIEGSYWGLAPPPQYLASYEVVLGWCLHISS